MSHHNVEKDNKKYKIEEATIPSDYRTKVCKLPKNVEIKRIISNILSALGIKNR